jgi:hypothetical protein
VVGADREQSEDLAIGDVLARGIEEGKVRARRAVLRDEELAGVFVRKAARTRVFGRRRSSRLECAPRQLRATDWEAHCRVQRR